MPGERRRPAGLAAVLCRERQRLFPRGQPDPPAQDTSRLRVFHGGLPEGDEIIRRFKESGEYAKTHELRTCLHPDQFVVLNSRRPDVVEKSLLELEYQAEVAEWIGADVVNIHGGGAFGDKQQALDDFARCLDRLSPRVRSRLTVENDDKIFTSADLLPVCQTTCIPLLYDAHHHRCHPEDLTVEQATEAALAN